MILSLHQQALLAYLAQHPEGADAQQIADAIGRNRRTVRYNLVRLAEWRHLKRQRLGCKGKTGYRFIYWIGPEIPPQLQPPAAPLPPPKPEEKIAPLYSSCLDAVFWGDVRDAIITNWGCWTSVAGAEAAEGGAG